MKTNHQLNGAAHKTVVIKGKRMVMLEETEFERLLFKADEFEPAMPEQDADGNYPALEALRTSLAIDIIRDRRRLGWTQAELARRAGIRLKTLQQVEMAQVSPSVRTIEKIDRALQKAEAKRANSR